MADTAAAIAKLKKQSAGVRDPIILACVNYLTDFLQQETNKTKFFENLLRSKKISLLAYVRNL